MQEDQVVREALRRSDNALVIWWTSGRVTVTLQQKMIDRVYLIPVDDLPCGYPFTEREFIELA